MTTNSNFSGIVAFMKVAMTGNFNKAARELGISSPAVSRSIARLEEHLGVRLLNRNARNVSLTPEGTSFFDECLPSVEQLIRSTQDLKNAGELAYGRLRVSSTVGFGRKCIAPLLPGFCAQYPDIRLEFYLNDLTVEFARDRVDVAIRNGRLDDAEIIARQIAPMKLIVCGSPDYLRHAGMPADPADIEHHKCITFQLADTGKTHDWEFVTNGNLVKIPVQGSQVFNDAELVASAVVAGGGLAQLANYQADPLIRSGAVVPLLPEFIAPGRGHFICYLSRKQLPTRIRVFVEYIVSALRDPTSN